MSALPPDMMNAFAPPTLSPHICHYYSSVIVCEGSNFADKISLENFFKTRGNNTDNISMLNRFAEKLIEKYSFDHFKLYNESHIIAGKNPDGTPDMDIYFYVRIRRNSLSLQA
jgi:hypothetical protein